MRTLKTLKNQPLGPGAHTFPLHHGDALHNNNKKYQHTSSATLKCPHNHTITILQISEGNKALSLYLVLLEEHIQSESGFPNDLSSVKLWGVSSRLSEFLCVVCVFLEEKGMRRKKWRGRGKGGLSSSSRRRRRK